MDGNDSDYDPKKESKKEVIQTEVKLSPELEVLFLLLYFGLQMLQSVIGIL